jgi:hypothetical protein
MRGGAPEPYTRPARPNTVDTRGDTSHSGRVYTSGTHEGTRRASFDLAAVGDDKKVLSNRRKFGTGEALYQSTDQREAESFQQRIFDDREREAKQLEDTQQELAGSRAAYIDIEKHKDEEHVGTTVTVTTVPQLAGGARRTKARTKKGYKSQKGGAAVPATLHGLKLYVGKGSTNKINNQMFGQTASILDTVGEGSKQNVFGFRPMVRPESLTQTLGAVLQQVRNSSVAGEKTLRGGGVDVLGPLRESTTPGNRNPSIACFNMKQHAARGAADTDRVRNYSTLDGAGDFFSTIDKFAEHLQKRLAEAQGVLGEMWKVHET